MTKKTKEFLIDSATIFLDGMILGIGILTSWSIFLLFFV